MKMSRGFVLVAGFFFSFLLCSANVSLAAVCSPAVQIAEDPTADFSDKLSIQSAYDYASSNVGSNFTLLISGEVFTENLLLDGGAVTLDGGYDCSFTNKVSRTKIFGTITIAGGSAKVAGGFGAVSTSQCDFDFDLDGFTSIGSCAGSADDCNDNDPNTYPGAAEICDGLDNNCDGQIDEGLTPTDNDGDGYYAIGSCGGATDDCNDNDPTIYPGAPEIPYDGIDQDCNGSDLTFAGDSCTGCHLPSTSSHSLTTPPDTTCATCHTPEVANVLFGHFGQTVRTADNNMSAGQTIVCGSCHDASANNHTNGTAQGNGSDFITNKVVAAYPNITCNTCHEDQASRHGTTAAHNNRVIDSSCGSCHTSNTTVLGQPGVPPGTLNSDADVDTLHRSDCALCHNYSGTLVDASLVRLRIAQGLNGTQISCLDCHTDKGSNHGNFTHPIEVGINDLSAGISCGSCHVVADWTEIEGTEHNVATNGAGSCATCHNSTRQEVLDVFMNNTPPINCLDCHSANAVAHGNIDHVALGYVTGDATCLMCHVDPAITFTDGSDPKVHNDCNSCHDPGTFALIGSAASNEGGPNTCTTCHTSGWEPLHTTNTPDHTSLVQVETTDCASCHSDPPPLTDAGDPKVHNGCTSCHDLDGGLISSAFGQDFTTGGNCTTCHGAAWHGSHSGHVHIVAMGAGDLSYDSPGILCGQCHVVSTWAEIEGIEHNVATNGAGSCATCHNSPRTDVQDAIANLNGDNPITCLACHGDKLMMAHGNVDHAGSGYVTGETACLVCHVDPATTFTDGSNPKVHDGCSSCHEPGTNALIGSAAGQEGGPNTCTSCHVGRDWTDHTIDHSGAGYVSLHSECTSCHAATLTAGQGFVDLLDNKKHDACTSCHAADGVIGTGPVDCSACHSGVTGDWTTHAEDHTAKVTQATGCASCHSNTVDYVSFVDLADNLKHDTCYVCHDNTTKLASATAGDCSQCHGGVAGDFSTHITQNHSGLVTMQTGCSSCHAETVDYANFIDAANNKKHDSCTNCHNVTTNAAIQPAGDCSQCHSGSWEATHSTAPDHSDLVNVGTTGCADCHSNPPPLTAADPKVHDDCSSCHNATTGALISSASGKTFAVGGDCTTCHTDTWRALHPGSPDHSDIVTVSGTNCGSCHDNTLISAAATTHDNCGSCHNTSTGELIDIAAGKSAPGNCVTCHGSAVESIHQSCTSCHGEPPTGSSFPNRERAHSEHDVLGFGSVSPSCAGCHSSAPHFDGSIQVNISNSFDDLSTGTPSFSDSTCSNISCHGGQTTPSWSTGTLSVNTQCTSCHAYGTSEYNSYSSGEHGEHSRYACTICHNTTKLVTGHFINLGTPDFEQDPADTIGGGSTRVSSYSSDGTCFTSMCHRSENWFTGDGGHGGGGGM